MENEFEELIKAAMHSSEPFKSDEIPALHKSTIELIKARKKGSPKKISVFLSIIENLFRSNKMAFTCVTIVALLLLINKAQFTTSEPIEMSEIKPLEDTILSIPSNTYLATLNNSMTVQAPVNTSTALSCISTIICKN